MKTTVEHDADISATDGREIKGAAMRERLRAATIELISEIGSSATTVARVAKRCGVTRGAVLHHYPTRNELIVDSAYHFWRARREIVRAMANDLVEGRVDLPEFIDRFYEDVFGASSIMTMLELIIQGRVEKDIRDSVNEVLMDLFRTYEELGELAFRQSGLSPKRIHDVMNLIVSALRGVRLQQMIDPTHDRSVAVRSLLVQAVEAIQEQEKQNKFNAGERTDGSSPP